MEEIWKDIKGFEGIYQISNFGRIKSLKRFRTGKNGSVVTVKEIFLKMFMNKQGYYRIGLNKNARRFVFSVHRLVAEAFIPNPDNLPQVNHKDENKQNNVVWINENGSIDYEKTNLEWCTLHYNINYGTGLKRRAIKTKKPILQFDINGNFIKEWPSAQDVEIKLGFLKGNIRSCCIGKYKQSYGYIWKYKKDTE